MSCMLENSLVPSIARKLPNPLAGIVFHYDKFSSFSTTQICEAAYLCSSNIPVRVLVSPSNIWAMEKLYTNLPGLPQGISTPKVMPLYIQEKHFTTSTMTKLMAVGGREGRMPLYLEVSHLACHYVQS